MGFDLNLAMNVMYPAANSAYSIMNVPPAQLHLPPGYSVVGTLLADPGHAAHAMAQADPDQQHIPNMMVRESNIFGLVAWNAVDSIALIAIRGTATIWDWIGDFEADPVSWFPDAEMGKVHMGFQLVYEHICLCVRDIFKSNCAGAKRLLITGHSLGGAVAVLTAFDITRNLNLNVVPELYTFAGPRTGDATFAKSFNAEVPECYRIVNFMDVVPHVPLPPLYEHVAGTAQEIVVHGGFRPLDPVYAHHLTTYLSGMQTLAPPTTAGAAGLTGAATEVVSLPAARTAVGPAPGN